MICKVEGCERKAFAKGMCLMHYKRMRKHGHTNVTIHRGRIGCLVKGCGAKHYIKGYCQRHHGQLLRHGKIFRTHYDKNEIIKHDDHAEIILYNRNSDEIARTLIDLEDIEKCKDIRWFLSGKGYVTGGVDSLHLAHHVLNHKGNRIIYVDHKNQKPLDNRKDNLRFATPLQNTRNSKKAKNNTSGYRGVFYIKNKDLWRASIRVNGKLLYLGSSKIKNKAARLYNEAAKKYFGEFAVLNEII